MLLQILIEVGGEILFELGWESAAESFRERPKAHPVLAGIGYLLLGSLLGLGLSLVYPEPLSKHEEITVLGVFLNPIGFGVLSHLFGELRRRRGHRTTNLATFWGGVGPDPIP